MAEDPRLVALLRFYKKKATVTRPEVGILTGKSVGAIAGTCNRAGITGWPKIGHEVVSDRPCQFPVLQNGQLHVCGKDRSDTDAESLRCSEHQDKVWAPDIDSDVDNTVEKDSAPEEAEDSKLVELVQFYKNSGSVTLPEVGVLTGKTPEQIVGVMRRHGMEPWPGITREVVQDRPCQFPVLKHGQRYVCGLFRSLSTDADPLRCSDHREDVWDPGRE